MPALPLSERFLMLLLITTNLLNYIDRGIVPGASGAFDSFIEGSETTWGTSAAFGALTSAFIVGFSVASVVVGHLAHRVPPFRLCGVGLLIWCLSMLLAGLAKPLKSYALLITARAVGGCGEAGFVTIGGPFIQDAAGARQGLWLGVFYAAIPAGTALGYGYGAYVAQNWTWAAAFYAQGLVMLVPASLFLLSKDDGSRIVNRDQRPPSLKSELQALRRSKTFRFTVLGYAGYAASVIGFSTFGPSIVVGLGLWTDSVRASLAFSATLAVSGALGTPLGGLALDAWTRRRGHKLKAALEVSIATVGAGALLITPAAFARDRSWFLASIGLGTLPLFAATSPMNVSIFEGVPREHRAFGIAVATLLMHAFGDVPSPVVVGLLKDRWAPDCAPDAHSHLGEACGVGSKQRGHLRGITFGLCLYFLTSLVFFGVARWRAARVEEVVAEPPTATPLLEEDG
jgi:MFS family permease